MAAERLSMRKIKEALRLAAAGHSNRAIARSLGISHSTVREYRERARGARLCWPLPPEWTDHELERRLVERWILARLRKHTFFSFAELNREIRRLLELLNDRPFQKLEGSRRSLFESLERPHLRPLPEQRYELAYWKKARVNIDYHIELLGHYYSVPNALVRQQVDVRFTATTVEILHGGRRVAAYRRSHKKGGFTTDPGHRPKAHQKYLEWTPSRIIAWASRTGPRTGELIQRILESKPHPEQGYRSCLGLLRLGQAYSPARLEAGCDRALRIGGISYRSVKSILQSGLDRAPLVEQASLQLPQNHEYVRGGAYYAQDSTHGEPPC